MISNRLFCRTAAVLLALAGLFPVCASADEAGDFYLSHQITIVCGGSAGGAYDLFARIMAQFLPKYLPGHPLAIVQNMPGAGNVISANYMYNSAPHDGSYLSVPLSAIVLTEVLDPKSVKYDGTKFGWLGVAGTLTDVISVMSTTPVKTIEDAKTHQVTIGTTGRGSQNYLEPALAAALLGLKFKMVLGYTGGTEVELAMERGEVDGNAQAWTTWDLERPDWVKQGKIIRLMQIGIKDPRLPEIPNLVDLVKTDRERAMAQVIDISSTTGFTIFAPPGVPADRLAVLRRAFDSVAKDPDFIQVMKTKLNETVDPVTGEAFQAYVEKSLHTSPEIVADVLKAIQ